MIPEQPPSPSENQVPAPRVQVLRPLAFKNAAAPAASAGQQAEEEKRKLAVRSQNMLRALAGDAKDMDHFRQFVKLGADLGAVNAKGETALHLAVREHNLPAVRLLLQKGADMHRRDHDGFTPLLRAIDTYNCDVAAVLVRADTALDKQVYNGEHAIHRAAFAGCSMAEAVIEMIDRGISPTLKDANGQSPMIHALRDGGSSTVLPLIYKGGVEKKDLRKYADVINNRTRPRSGWHVWEMIALAAGKAAPATAVTPAALPGECSAADEDMFEDIKWKRGSDSMAARLKGGANTKARNDDGDTPLIFALRHVSEPTAELFIGKTDVSARGRGGETALHCAARLGSSYAARIVRLLIAAGADLDRKDSIYGQTPLMIAAGCGNVDGMNLLLKAGANPALKDKLGLTASRLAALGGHAELEPDLLRAEAAHEKQLKTAKEKSAAQPAFAKAAPAKTVSKKAPAAKPAKKKPTARKLPSGRKAA